MTLRGASTVSPLTWAFLGGGDGIRTHGLYIANVALCQLSYTPDEQTGYPIEPGFRKCGARAVDGGRSAPGGRSTLGKGLGASATNALVLVPRPGKARLGGPAHHLRLGLVVFDGPPGNLGGHQLALIYDRPVPVPLEERA